MKARAWILYGTYTVVCFAVAAVLMFPQKKAADVLSGWLTGIRTGTSVRIDTVRLNFPGTVVALLPEITVAPDIRIQFDYASLSPDFSSLLAMDPAFWYSAGVNGGFLHGRISRSDNGGSHPSSVTCKLDHVRIQDTEFTIGPARIKASFAADGSAEFDLSGNGRASGQGTLMLTSVTARISDQLLSSIGIETVDFDTITVACTLQQDTVIITDFKASGKQAVISGTGDIQITSPLDRSVCNLEGHIRPTPAYVKKLAMVSSVAVLFKDSKNSGIPFTITGTIEKPVFGL